MSHLLISFLFVAATRYHSLVALTTHIHCPTVLEARTLIWVSWADQGVGGPRRDSSPCLLQLPEAAHIVDL